MDKKYDHQLFEKQAREQWIAENTYKAENNPGPLYSIDTPPPTVSGALHIGHIFSYTQTDIIARYKRMQGFSVFYPFGFDDNGLATERFVEKKRGIQGYLLKRSEFIKICLEETGIAEEQFQNLWKRIGLSADWDACYSTISDDVRKISQESFIRLYKKGLIYRKNEPALYCTTCRTSVAQAELDDAEKQALFNDIVFKTTEGKELLIGTTRPELLPSCVALLYHPADQRYRHLKNKKAIVPLYNGEVPILEDVLVDPEKGTGLVMVCTFGDKNDIIWYKAHQLPYKQSIGLDGRMTELAGPLAGLKVKEAREKIIELLKTADLIKSQKSITHSVNVHERCKQEIEYILLAQWFFTILNHKTEFLALADKIKWYPEFMKARYINWVENLSWDWGISRQRFYGIPFPVWHCTECNEILLADVKNLPIDPQETKYSGKCTRCGSSNIVPDTDVMDTWNTSSLTPYICFSLFTKNTDVFSNQKIDKFLPMSMRPQAHDIIRTWAFYTIVKTWAHHESIPWKDIVISGHVLSDSKEKLSKSKDNTKTDPEQLLKQYPADVIRYWTASGSLGHDILFSDKQLSIGSRLVTKLWNAFLFIEQHAKAEKPKVLEWGIANEWIAHRATECFKEYAKHLDNYAFNQALDVIEQFFWNDFCDNYLELIKDQLFKPEQYKAEHVATTRWMLHQIGLRILQMYAPYLPFVTEAIYQQLYKKSAEVSSLHQTKFNSIQISYVFNESAYLMQKILALIVQVRKLKSENQLSLKAEINSLELFSSSQQTLDAIAKHEALIKGITHATVVRYKKEILAEAKSFKSDDTIVMQIVV